MTSATVHIRNAHGIHCRPSAVIAREAQSCAAEILVGPPGKSPGDAKSILGLLALGLGCGDAVEIRVSGPDEEPACRRMAELFETNFDFPRT